MSAVGLGRRVYQSATILEAKQTNGFHLLRIDGYSQTTTTILPGQKLSSQEFNVGCHIWRIDYYPNGRDTSSANHNAISLYLQLTDRCQQRLQARYSFSLLDHGGNAAYELPAKNGSFTSVPIVNNYTKNHNASFGGGEEEEEEDPGPGCGYEEFIGKEELKERREHLIRGDIIVVRCDVCITEFANSWLAHDELNALELDGGEEVYEAPGTYFGGAPRHTHQRKRRADDNEYVDWCLAQRPRGRP